MKRRIIKSILTIALVFMAVPMMGQDWMEIQFKDGTFSKFYLEDLSTMEVTKYDNEDNISDNFQYQHIVVKDYHYFYNLDDIDNIKFVKYEEELVDSKIESTTDAIMPIMTQCETIEMAKDNLETLKKCENVEDAWCEDDCLYIKVSNSGIIPFHFSHGENDLFSEELSNSMRQNRKEIMASSPILKANGNEKELRVVIANQLHFNEDKDLQFNLNNCFTPLINDFNSQPNIHADYIKKPTIDSFFLNDIFDYDIVFLITHGFYIDNYHGIMSADILCQYEKNSIGQEEQENAYDKLKEFRKELRKNHPELPKLKDKHLWFGFSDEVRNDPNTQSCHKYWIAYPLLREPFFEEIAQNEQHNPNSFFFNGACMSMMENTHFAETMSRKGFGTYFGYNHTNTVGPTAGTQYLYYLLQGYSLGKALDELPDWAKINDRTDWVAELETYPKTLIGRRNIFIMPTNTIEISDDEATSSFNSNQSVIVSGIAKSLNPDNVGIYRYEGTKKLDDVTVGFFCDDSHVSVTDVQIVSRSKNEIRFAGKLTGLDRGKTYSYYAYSYDGENYNYGESYSFKIESQPTDGRIVMLSQKVGDTTYEVYKINTNKNDYHENPDGWKCYKSSLVLSMTKSGKTNTYTIDDNVYLDAADNHHSGQKPCVMLDFNSKKIYVFICSKDDQPYYSMDGYAYNASMSNMSFKKETVFTESNFGWYPYFVGYSGGQPVLSYFSFAGYFTIRATRNSDGSWYQEYDEDLYPDEAEQACNNHGSVTVIGNP